MKLEILFLIFLSSCATNQPVSKTYKGFKQDCEISKLTFDSNLKHDCFCKIEGENGKVIIFIPIQERFCKKVE